MSDDVHPTTTTTEANIRAAHTLAGCLIYFSAVAQSIPTLRISDCAASTPFVLGGAWQLLSRRVYESLRCLSDAWRIMACYIHLPMQVQHRSRRHASPVRLSFS